jgi:hypothetical protein
LSPHGAAAPVAGIRADGIGDADVIDASVGPAGVISVTPKPRITTAKMLRDHSL